MPRDNSPSKRIRKNRPFQYETLEPRKMLSANLPGNDGVKLVDIDLAFNRDLGEQQQSELIRDYLGSQKETEYLQQGESDLRLTAVKHGLSVTATRFQQTWQGLPVFGAEVLVNQGPDGTVQSVFDQGLGGLDIAAERFSVSSMELAEVAAIEHAEIGGQFADTQGELMWYVNEEGSASRAWVVTVFGTNPTGDFLTVVDYATNEVLMQENRAAFATGDGFVFEPNPYQTQGNDTNIVDNNDANNATLTNQRIQVVLEGLDDGTGLLNGEFVNLASLNSPTLADVDANEPSRVYDYTRDDPRFEQVVVYHSVDQLARYFHQLGFDDDSGTPNGIRDFPTLANAHWDNADNSFYSTGDDAIHFGDGGVDDAEDADIVAHEYGHAVQFNQNPGWGGGEMGAMGEGFGDYLAASFYADFGDSAFQALHAAAVGEWDATSYSNDDPPNLRRVDGNKLYPTDLVGQVHADGEIWSRALWDIRTAIGATAADTVILESHFALPSGSSMVTAAEQILVADQNLFGGSNAAEIRQAFQDRGILEAPPTIGDVALDKSSYLVTDTVVINLIDANAVGPLNVNVSVDNGDVETVTLTGTNGNFSGTIATTPGAANAGDGSLNVSLGDELTVTYVDLDDGSGGTTTSTDTAVIANITQFPSTDTPVSISDNTTVSSTLVINQSGTVNDVNVKLDITHTFDADLAVTLVGPNGTRVPLFAAVGDSGDNFTGTELDSEASTLINDGTAPFTGVFRPQGDLSVFNGTSITGTWTLEITDSAGGDVGTLDAWSLCIDVGDNNMGSVAFDSDAYTVGGLISVDVFDGNASAGQTVTITSTNGDSETLALTGASGIFSATIASAAGAASAGDGIIQAAVGDAITVTYTDLDDGTGNSNTVTDGAVFSNVGVYESADTPLSIIDGQTTLSTISVADSGSVLDLDVKLDITHTWDSDLDVFLIAPDGTRVELFQDVGGSGDDFVGTILDDEASTPIALGSAPFTGSFRPVGSLAALDGLSITGDWTLEITDDATGDQGTLNEWSICIETDGGGTHTPVVSVISPGAVAEGDSSGQNMVDFQISLDSAATSVVSVDYATVAGTAQAGSDFVSTSGTATFQPGQTTATVSVAIEGDRYAEGHEDFALELSNISGADPGTTSAVATINEDDNYVFGDIIDFGPEGGDVVSGGIGVTNLSYDPVIGAGWLPGAVNLGTELTERGDALVVDRAFVNRGEFVVDIANGNYDVTLRMGVVRRGGDTIRATIEGVQFNEAPAIGPNVRFEYPVTVTDGQLNFEFNGLGLLPTYRISGIEIVSAGGNKTSTGNIKGENLVLQDEQKTESDELVFDTSKSIRTFTASPLTLAGSVNVQSESVADVLPQANADSAEIEVDFLNEVAAEFAW